VPFTINATPVPTLTVVSPAQAAVSTSASMTIAGTNLSGATINFAGTGISATNVVSISSTQMAATFVIDSTAAQGTHSFTVTTPGGNNTALTFSVLPPVPVLASMQPNSVRNGKTNVGINFNGTNLTGSSIGSIQAFLSGAPTNIITMSQFQAGATQVRVLWTMAAGAPLTANGNSYTVTITTPSSTSNALPFTMQ